jgi:hypothetical protein
MIFCKTLLRGFLFRSLASLGVALLVHAGPVLAFDDPNRPDDAMAQEARESASGQFKFTAGRYALRGAPDGTDLNLRWRQADATAWVGSWSEPRAGEGRLQQARAGYEYAFRPTALAQWSVSVQPSLQLASAGFVGGSLTLEAGEPWFGSIGIGRTNQKPYVNLNFDPNDAVSIAFGHRADNGTTYYLLWVGDDRLGTLQRHVHWVGRWPLAAGQRLTLDFLAKRGIGEDLAGLPTLVRAGGVSVGLDQRQWFVRLAWDRQQNFGPSDALRISVGARF